MPCCFRCLFHDCIDSLTAVPSISFVFSLFSILSGVTQKVGQFAGGEMEAAAGWRPPTTLLVPVTQSM